MITFLCPTFQMSLNMLLALTNSTLTWFIITVRFSIVQLFFFFKLMAKWYGLNCCNIIIVLQFYYCFMVFKFVSFTMEISKILFLIAYLCSNFSCRLTFTDDKHRKATRKTDCRMKQALKTVDGIFEEVSLVSYNVVCTQM